MIPCFNSTARSHKESVKIPARTDKGRRLLRIEAVADPWLGLYIFRRRGVGFEFFAEIAHEDAQIFRLLGAAAAPDRREDNAMREHLSAVQKEELKKLEFLRCEMYRTPANLHLALLRVDSEISGFVRIVFLHRRRGAAQKRANARRQFSHAEALGHVIVG